jgi:hypothetical protein
MKKFMYIMLAFLAGLAYSSCEEKQEEQISITLTAPPAGDLFNLAEVDRVNFDWTSQGVMESSSYKWLLSDNANLSDAVEKVVSGSSFEVQKAELEEIMAQLGFLPEENPKEHTFYWSIAAGDVKAEARPIKLKRKALPLIPNIYLTAPANNASFDLRSHTADVEFNWIAAPTGVFTGKTFNLLLSTSGTNFSSAATVVKQYIVASPAIVTVTELDQWAAGAGVAKGDEIDLYWTLQANGTFDEAPTT